MIPRYTPLGKGRRTLENEAARHTVWPIILRRCRRTCEGCGRRDRSLEWGHIFGRPGSGLCLGAWANTAALTMALCVVRGTAEGCHTQIDRYLDVALRRRLEWIAVHRLAADYQRDAAKLAASLNLLDPADVVRALVRELEGDGLTPAGEVMAIR